MEKFIVEHITEELLALKRAKSNIKDMKTSLYKSVELLKIKQQQKVYKTMLNAIAAHKESKNDKNQKKEKDYLVT